MEGTIHSVNRCGQDSQDLVSGRHLLRRLVVSAALHKMRVVRPASGQLSGLHNMTRLDQAWLARVIPILTIYHDGA